MANTVNLHVEEAGQGTPVVLLHGFPLSGASWRAQQQRLSQHVRVIVPDLRGHGRSPAPAGVYEMDLLARDVLALLDALNLPRAVLMGHSMGGYVALAAYRRAPERFLALGLIASQAGADTEEGRQGRQKLAEKVAVQGSAAAAEAMLPKLFAPTLPPEAPIVDLARQLILNTPGPVIISSLQGMAQRPDSTCLLPTIAVPVLLLAGAADQIIPPAKTQSMAASLPAATVAMIPQCGHMPMLEQPEATAKALADFVGNLKPLPTC